MKKKKTFTEDEAMHYFTMILIALYYLHSTGIVHQDLKPSNILIDELPGGVKILKIGGFGTTRTTPDYIAPEALDDRPPTKYIDMWALGIILYQLVASYNHPFQCENKYALMMVIKDNEPDLASLPPTVSPFIKNTIKALLEKNPEARPDAQTLID